jgi:hypothetical protein
VLILPVTASIGHQQAGIDGTDGMTRGDGPIRG